LWGCLFEPGYFSLSLSSFVTSPLLLYTPYLRFCWVPQHATPHPGELPLPHTEALHKLNNISLYGRHCVTLLGLPQTIRAFGAFSLSQYSAAQRPRRAIMWTNSGDAREEQDRRHSSLSCLSHRATLYHTTLFSCAPHRIHPLAVLFLLPSTGATLRTCISQARNQILEFRADTFTKLSSAVTKSHRLRRAGFDRHPSNFCCLYTSVVGGESNHLLSVYISDHTPKHRFSRRIPRDCFVIVHIHATCNPQLGPHQDSAMPGRLFDRHPSNSCCIYYGSRREKLHLRSFIPHSQQNFLLLWIGVGN
jgi:hypothetical protein